MSSFKSANVRAAKKRIRLAYNLANSLRRLALLRSIRHWSVRTLREKLVEIGANWYPMRGTRRSSWQKRLFQGSFSQRFWGELGSWRLLRLDRLRPLPSRRG